MEPLAISLVILSALFHALRDFFTKQAQDKLIFMWLFQIVALVYYFPIFLYFVFTAGVPTDWLSWQYVILSVGVHFFYWLFLIKALEQGDLSHVYPIIRSSPALVLLLAIVFLNEQVTWLGSMGILLVTFGVYIINLNRLSLQSVLEPIRGLFREDAVRYAFLTFLCVTAYSIIDKLGVQYVHPIVYIYILVLAMVLLYTPLIVRQKSLVNVGGEWEMHKGAILANGFFVMTSYALILFAFTIERVSYIVGLRQLSIVFAVLLGSILLHEKQGTLRLMAACIIFVGAFMISVASLRS